MNKKATIVYIIWLLLSCLLLAIGAVFLMYPFFVDTYENYSISYIQFIIGFIQIAIACSLLAYGLVALSQIGKDEVVGTRKEINIYRVLPRACFICFMTVTLNIIIKALETNNNFYYILLVVVFAIFAFIPVVERIITRCFKLNSSVIEIVFNIIGLYCIIFNIVFFADYFSLVAYIILASLLIYNIIYPFIYTFYSKG